MPQSRAKIDLEETPSTLETGAIAERFARATEVLMEISARLDAERLARPKRRIRFRTRRQPKAVSSK